MKKTKHIKMLSIILTTIILLFLIINFILIPNAKIKVKVSTSGDWLLSGNTYYYSITKLGKFRCKQFEGNTDDFFIGLEYKELENYNPSNNSNDELQLYLDNIVELVKNKKFKYPMIGEMYLYNSRCFVTVVDQSPKMTWYDILYEYNFEKNTLTEIARFEGVQIEQIYINE